VPRALSDLQSGADEAKAFDRIRSRFIQACAEHLDQEHSIAAVAEQPDHYFSMMMETTALSRRARAGRIPSRDSSNCYARLMGEEGGRVEATRQPTSGDPLRVRLGSDIQSASCPLSPEAV